MWCTRCYTLRMAGTVRKSVPLSRADRDGLQALRTDLAWQEAALEIAGVEVSETPSEAEVLHALVQVGNRVLADRVTEKEMEAGYAELAATETAEDRELARALSRRAAARIE